MMMAAIASWYRRLLPALALLAVGGAIGHFAALGQLPQGQARAAPREALVISAARSVGVRQCLGAIGAVAQRATASATLQDIIVDWDRQTPDGAPFFSLTGLGAGAQRAALSISAFPSPGNCAILVERISATPQSCTAVAASQLPRFVSGTLIPGIMVYQNPQVASETYTLVTNGTGCLVIRRQAALRWPPQ